MTTTGEELQSVEGVINLFAGSIFTSNEKSFISLMAGPSFINGNTLFGIKPSFGFYFSKSQSGWYSQISSVSRSILISSTGIGYSGCTKLISKMFKLINPD